MTRIHVVLFLWLENIEQHCIVLLHMGNVAQLFEVVSFPYSLAQFAIGGSWNSEL